MGDKEDYLTLYRVFFENFAATVNPEDQLPVNIAGYTITEAELPGEVIYWTTQYLTEKQCPQTLMTPLRRIILDEVRIASKKQPNEFGYKSDESVYIALRLMQAVTARVNDVCLRYLDNSKLDTLPPPPPSAQRDLKTVSCATKNSRRVMEDRHVEIGNLEALFGIETTEPTSFYAVYDGHAGSAAATYCAAHLHQYLVENPQFTTDLRRAMRDAFIRTDAEFIMKSNQERANGGSTAVVVCVRARRLVAAWAGDSLALLAKRMRLMQLVRPHKPGRQDEKDRIESSGGTVIYWGTWRVNGQLAVSRAIGDAQYKPYVTARPEIATVDLDGDEDFVVVACDGLWDFVSEDDVALAVYRQLAADPDDLKAVTKRLIVQAKRQGSADNISIIVVFLKDPRDIAADNRPPMDLRLDNPLVTAPPFALESEVCKREVDVAAAAANTEGSECADADVDADVEAGDNGVDNSDSDSEDLGPETAVDADDVDAENRNQEPAPPTPPADTVGDGHVDGALVDNVAESGEDSEDEWNYFKGEGERDKQNPSQQHEEPPLSETPCQDYSASESSSLDMNNSPLNPDAPVFIPGSVVGVDKLLAESPRKPLPMDDIDLPDVAQFQTEAVVRPADLLDLDNCDHHNGHHNVSINEAVKEHFNGNDKCNMDSLGFGFNVDIEPDKVKDTSLIQDFERIQKDTTDFCNVQVFQTHADTNPFAVEGDDELFERLKNKERDPMSMSFYQEKDDDTCERLSKNDSHIDLNAVQPLPDSDDEDLEQNGVCENTTETEKENLIPQQYTDLYRNETNIQEPNNDIMLNDRTDIVTSNVCSFPQEDNFEDYNITNLGNIQNFANIEFGTSNITQDAVLQTDTPESHKLLFEQIPEIPDGKSSELGFVNDDINDPSESEKDDRPLTPQEKLQDIEMECQEDSTPETQAEIQDEHMEKERVQWPESSEHLEYKEKDVIPVSEFPVEVGKAISSIPNVTYEAQTFQEAITPESIHDMQENVTVEIHQQLENVGNILGIEGSVEAPKIEINSDHLTPEAAVFMEDDIISDSPSLSDSPLPPHSPLPAELSLPSESPIPGSMIVADSPVPSQSPLPSKCPDPNEIFDNLTSPVPRQTPELIQTSFIRESTPPKDILHPSESPLPTESPLPYEASLPSDPVQIVESKLTMEPVLHMESYEARQSPLASKTQDLARSPSPVSIFVEPVIETPMYMIGVAESESAVEEPLEAEKISILTEPRTHSPLPAEVPLPRESPIPGESPMPIESPLPTESPVPTKSPVPTESPLPTVSPLPTDTFVPVHYPIPAEYLAPVESIIRTESPVPTDSPFPAVSPIPAKSPIFGKGGTFTSESYDLAKSLIPTESTTDVEATIWTEPHAPVETLIPPESPIPSKSPLPADLSLPAESPLPAEIPLPANSPLLTESIVPISAPLITKSPLLSETLPLEESYEAESTLHSESPLPIESVYPTESTILTETLSAESPLPSASPLPAKSPLPTDAAVIEPIVETQDYVPVHMLMTSVATVSPTPMASIESTATLSGSVATAEPSTHADDFLLEFAEEALPCSPAGGPAPDVVPDERGDLPHPSSIELVTDIDIGIPESHAQEICVPVTSEIRLDDAVQLPVSITPPSTPAVEPLAASVADASLAAESSTRISAIVGVGAVAAATATAVVAAVTSKAKIAGSAKKSPTTPAAKPDARTPKSAPKSATTPRTPVTVAATKKKTEAPRAAPTAPRSTAPKPATPSSKQTTSATKSATPTTKSMTPLAKSTTPIIKSTTSAAKPAVAATKAAAPVPKTTPTGPKATIPAKTAPTSRPITSKSNIQPAKPSSREMPAAKPPIITRPPLSKPAPKTAPPASGPRAVPPAKPKPKPTEKSLPNGDLKEIKIVMRPASRPAAAPARPAPRAAPKSAAPAPPKTAGAKPVPRAPLDKQSKDLANKRLTTKTAPPRTMPAKTAPAKNAMIKIVPKKSIDSPKKEQIINDSLPNGTVEEPVKPPLSPPITDNALLPDVIA